jgi:protein TonB
LDEPARRLLWIIPLSIAIWAILLSGFSLILMRTKAPPAELQPIEARLIDIPKAVGGLQGNGGAIHPAAPAIPKAKPIVKPHPVAHVKKVAPLPPVIRSPYGTEKSTEAPGVEEKPGAAAGSASDAGASSNSGTGSGIGTDTVGARAVYAPTPVIPDDLREDVMQTEAVAHFNVSFDGTSEVTLAKPTSSPRLNQVLLDALKQWKFFPAVKNGVAIVSSFDVRIPISVQ